MYIGIKTSPWSQKILATEELKRICCDGNQITLWYHDQMELPECMAFRTEADAQNSYRWIWDNYIQELSGGYKRLLFPATI